MSEYRVRFNLAHGSVEGDRQSPIEPAKPVSENVNSIKDDLRRIAASKLLMAAFKSTPRQDTEVRIAFGAVFEAMTKVK